MRFRFIIEGEVERESGLFASRDEIFDAIREAIESANPDTVDGVGANGDSVYNITEWDVSE
jgi:hypothetical protein